MRIVFIGTVKFSFNALSRLIALGANIVAVITKENSTFNADYADLTSLCIENNIPYKFVNDINHENNRDYILSFRPDILYCFGWSGLLKADLLNVAEKGVVGFHPAGLPYNRGRHPIIWALALGLECTASTFFLMNEGADTGDIISQKILDVEYSDDAATLYEKITDVALKQIEEFTIQFINDKVVLEKQNCEIGNSWRKRGKKDGEIDFRMNSRAIYNLVRSLTRPYVGSHVKLIDGTEVKIWKVKECKSDEINLEPGKVLSVDNEGIKIKCSEGAVMLVEHEFNKIPEVGSYL